MNKFTTIFSIALNELKKAPILVHRKLVIEPRQRREKLEREERILSEEIDAARIEHAKWLAHIHAFPTSSTGQISGRKVIRQIKFISVDGFNDQNRAELEFLSEVYNVGGNGVINMAIRRHRGGYISIQGDAVELN